MLRDDIRGAIDRGDRPHARELFMALRHFLSCHPEAAHRKTHAGANSRGLALVYAGSVEQRGAALARNGSAPTGKVSITCVRDAGGPCAARQFQRATPEGT